ncbi:hypothetical protein [Dictyobacter formicarum]|uniref:Peptidase S1 domain-containing protein n=1 Tax=Dictyobacter formicarum TaxID=2778368 RepID=A0ABQ3VDA1_9CHLR|nr:hypothetical protein [Dictyobacter formicarum]GHO84132.1 hypothetical protein KSZ_21380 [Dictyobacter formicarum]
MQKVRPIQGGTRIAGSASDGTLGLVVTNLGTKKTGFLTAGHVVGGQNTLVGQPTPDTIVGLVTLNTFAPKSSVDIAFVNVAAGVEYDLQTIWSPTTGSFKIDVMSSYPDKDQKVKLCGTGQKLQEGTVIYENANVNVEEDGVRLELKGVSIATYPSSPSDSGAPIVSVDREEVEWLGIHGGSVQISGKLYAWFTPLATINQVVRIYDADQKESTPAITLEA